MELSGLYILADYSFPVLHSNTLSVLDQLLSHHMCLLQYRDKQSSASERKQRALQLLSWCRAKEIPLIINDDVPLAREIDADGVHLGQSDLPLDQAIAVLGRKKIIGVSCYHSLQRAQAAQALGASYVAFGAIAPSQTKTEASTIELAQLKEYCRLMDIPVCAIGGISQHNIDSVVACGVDLVAVAHAVLGQNNIQQAIQHLGSSLDSPPVRNK